MIRNRYRRIVLFFGRLLFGFILWDLLLPKIGLRFWAQRTRPQRLRRSAVALRRLAVEMGGVLIKVGQFLSTRVDVLPNEFTEELADLQDEVDPERFEDIRAVAEAEFGQPLENLFAKVETRPLAAASLGQVHRAQLFTEDQIDHPEGEYDVVIKVQRPDIEQIIATDLAALRTVGNWLKRYRPISRRADVPALLEEFTRILYEEIDYLNEGRNAETFGAHFQDYPGVRVPRVVWTHTTKRVLTLENVFAIKITDYEAITAAGVDRAEVAVRLIDTYLKQIFEDGFFHADPHPGNLFVQPLPYPEGAEDGPRPWLLTFVDFGMVGRLPPRTLDGLREMLIGIGTQDASRVVKSYQMLGVLLPSADLELLEKAEAKAFDTFWGRNMDELRQISPQEIRKFTREFRELVYQMPFQIPQDFIFLARAVGILAGMCTGLDPQFNIWEHLSPYAQRLIVAEALENPEIWFREVKTYLQAFFSLPVRLDKMVTRIERGEVEVKSPDVVRAVKHLAGAQKQVVGAVLFMAFLSGGIQLYLGGEADLALGLAVLGAASLVWTLWAGRRG